MTLHRRATPGEPLRFLLIVLLLWCGGRLIAYGVPQMLLAPAGEAGSAPPVIEALRDALASAAGDAAPPALEPGQSVRRVNGRSANALVMAMHPQSREIAPAGLPRAMLAQHQLLYWRHVRPAFVLRTYDASPFTEPAVHGAYDKFQLREPGQQRLSSASPGNVDRLSLDAWGFVRPGSAVSPIGGRGQYGGSQAGTVLRYRLGDGSASAPTLFARATRAFSGPSQAELAIGASIRPVKKLPLRVAAEQRLALDDSGFSRPAFYAYTEMPRLALPQGVSLDSYGQAGAVGVADSAWFFDLQLVAQKQVARDKQRDLSLGVGLWSGGQGPIESDDDSGLQIDHVVRVDIGPGAAIGFSVAGQPASVALDWRQRVAGNADPGSGPALTVSTRF
ncbi:MAG: hypothetical protein AAFX04_14355 [Pseudomonadota bacterium]